MPVPRSARPVVPTQARSSTRPAAATLKVRDDVNQIIRLRGDELGIDNPGQIYHVRAQQENNLPPAQECLQRR